MQPGKQPILVAERMIHLAREKDRFLTPMQVLKLVYIAHGWQLGLHGNPLVNEAIEAWQYGPVVPSVYRRYKRFGGGFIDEVPSAHEDVFSDTERSTIQQVFEGYGKMSGISLSALTHEPGTPWSQTVEQSGIGAEIPNDLIEDYYRRRASR